MLKKDQLNNYINNTSSVEQAHQFEQELAHLEDGSELDYLLEELLLEDNFQKDYTFIERAFNRFKANITYHESVRKRPLHLAFTFLKNVAAILMLPLIAFSIYQLSNHNNFELTEEYLAFGDKKEVVLPDGSLLWLKAGSKLIYPNKFSAKLRQVFLLGEAYIEVAKDKERPFVVSAGEVKVEVLGTKFNIKSYSEDESITIALMEGAVRMVAEHNGDPITELLSPGDHISFNKESGEITKTDFDVCARKEWYNGNGFYFIDKSLAEITVELERYFNVNIIIENAEFKNDRYYAIFTNNESLTKILSALNASGNMNINQQSDVIYIN